VGLRHRKVHKGHDSSFFFLKLLPYGDEIAQNGLDQSEREMWEQAWQSISGSTNFFVKGICDFLSSSSSSSSSNGLWGNSTRRSAVKLRRGDDQPRRCPSFLAETGSGAVALCVVAKVFAVFVCFSSGVRSKSKLCPGVSGRVVLLWSTGCCGQRQQRCR
jgi:hypothetical protein